jgi:hypothetical protein
LEIVDNGKWIKVAKRKNRQWYHVFLMQKLKWNNLKMGQMLSSLKKKKEKAQMAGNKQTPRRNVPGPVSFYRGEMKTEEEVRIKVSTEGIDSPLQPG